MLMNQGNYTDAAKITSTSRDLLNGRLSKIEGLCQLRTMIREASERLSEKIVDQIVDILVVDPFEHHMFDLIQTMSEQRVMESEQCSRLHDKVAASVSLMRVRASIDENLAGDQTHLTQLVQMVGSSTISVRNKLRMSVMFQIVCQLDSSRSAHKVLEKICAESPSSTKIMKLYWEGAQNAVEALVSDHLDITPLAAKEPIDSKKPLFRFDATAFASGTSTTDPSLQSPLVVCRPSAFNIVPMFPWLRKLMDSIEKETAESPCQLRRFVHSFVMELFVERVKAGLADRIENALRRSDNTRPRTSVNSSPLVVCRPSAFNIVPMFPWLRKLMDSIEKETAESPCQLRRFVHSFVMELFVERVKAGLADRIENALRRSDNTRPRTSVNSKVLPSCERVLELCQEVHGLIVSMDLYADRFAALWLLVLTDYNKNVTDMYERTTKSLSEIDGIPSRRKISAAWAADEDISRLLMSLPNWMMAATEATPSTPSVPNFESEKDIRQRNERESEILIGNLATQKKIERAELLTDMSDVRALAALHESLRWFACEIRRLINSLPQHVKSNLRGCMVQVRYKDGQITDNEPVLDAMEDCICRLDSISDTCLLMLHLELRVHCFFHLLPLARPRNVSVHEELDAEVVELGRDLQAFYQLLSSILSQPKLRYIFDGLGHLCAAIFIHSSQHMPRLSESGKKRVCRNIWGVQQRLSQITSRREAELDRARAFFELLAHEPDRLLAQLPDRRSQFTPVEMGHLVALSVRSHPTLSSQHGALEQRLAQLSSLLKQPV
ncbi:hypothetical protein COOONC_13712 [Cooperia oncophora]